MKIKIYAPFLISLSLALASTNSDAKLTHHAIKKHSISSTKRAKLTARKKGSHQSFSRKRDLVTAKSFQKDADSQEFKYSNLSTHLYPINEANRSREEFQSNFNQNRIHSVILPDKKYNSTENTTPFESSLHFNSAHGIIETSFNHAAHKVGLSDDIIEELTRIFAWDIDFASNLKPGDQFTIIYKEGRSAAYRKRNSGQIISAEFMTNGKIFTAVRYKDPNGIVSYYTPEGKSMQKAFLSAPVDYARISSHFDSHRRHPVLNRIRAHKGVDYAARTGTPVKSAGDGLVSFRGRKGGYGQVIIIKHGEHYETLYAHLSDFKRGLKSGDIVKQGEIIGYVGQTGLATGPHLHYEFRIDGVHRNPESLNHKHSMPIDRDLMADFKSQTRPYLAQLYQAKASSLLAKNLNSTN
ncbi:MAG: peptidoglycan DD-metalloendopeptidase family protein [Methylosarcina sp.]